MEYKTLEYHKQWKLGDEVSYDKRPHLPREWFSVAPDYFGELVGGVYAEPYWIGRRPINQKPTATHEEA